MNPYSCDKCDWRYAWTMGDRIKAVKRHELAHLLEQRDMASKPSLQFHTYRLSDYRARLIEMGVLGEPGVPVS